MEDHMNNKKKRKDIIKRKIINKNYKKVTIHIKIFNVWFGSILYFIFCQTSFIILKKEKNNEGKVLTR